MNKSQASMEYLLVAGLIILIILPSIYIFYSYSHRSNKEIAQSQVNQFGTQIIDAAEKVYYLGGPSKTTLELTMPKGVIGMEIWRNQELVFFLNDGSEIAFKSRVNITSNMICMERCYYNFTERFYSPGIKHIVVKAEGDNVLITLKDEEEYIVTECIDNDGDDYGVCPNCGIENGCTYNGHDCDDTNPLIYPGATEVCNGVDDDCDTLVDENWPELGTSCTLGVGACEATGQYVCKQDGTGTECNAVPGTPNQEICDDLIDNDCDSLTDLNDSDCAGCALGETKPCLKQKGVCKGSYETCTAGGIWPPGCDDSTYLAWNSSYENPETSCDGLDNDCNGLTDNPLTAPLCENQVGVCAGSTKTCGNLIVMYPPDEDYIIPPIAREANGWQDCNALNYGLDYEYPESTCYDYKDNDCDGDTDCDDSDCYYITAIPGFAIDSVLVTDVSGSMKDCGEYAGLNCLNTKINLAKQADLQFVDTVLNITGNKIGAVSYESNVRDVEPLTDSKITLQNEINSYYANGGTCICCGVNRAKDMLSSSSNKKFMVVMSDGAATMYCDNFNDYTGSGSSGTSDPIDKQWAIDAGQNACDQNITVFTVGFGEDADHETLKQIACDESLYYNASNASDIIDIYKEIGKEIFIKTCIVKWRSLICPFGMECSIPCPIGMYCMT